MSIDFHASQNRSSYTGRLADKGWMDTMAQMANPVGKRVIDIGCGGGIYSAGWALSGAESVIGVDFSQVMLDAARENTAHLPQIAYHFGDARRTGLPAGSADIVFVRALIHHLDHLDGFLEEAYRLLAPGGICILQDRTMEDVIVPASAEHLRGYFFEAFPRLLKKEEKHRPSASKVQAGLKKAGFSPAPETQLWEIRKTYDSWGELERDLRNRTGRSILHELNDHELEELISLMRERLDSQLPIIEQDRWTIWRGVKG
ncbi:class I SAM-dependent methyltransferase [Brevibacillus borstelensis]|uniref:class I SAM-dependent methyltransferase n=1 Tax=Brevibacillus borstelensis TaxID=45462 RepID=UPI0030BD1342